MEEAFEDEAEQTMTINEYIEAVDEAELEADMVLGGDEGKECTYSRGYMKRQAIFSCLTCVPAANAAVCTACSLSCHDGHEVVELWTKRNLRCDCGNSKFTQFSCKFFPDKDPDNAKNSYNQNFRGLYCTCNRPYPDPEAKEQVEMIQCCICEDWFHENHIGLESAAEIPRDEDGEPLYEDFICQDCAVTLSFLKHYPATIWVSSNRNNECPSQDNNMLSEKPAACESPEKLENGSCSKENLTSHPARPSESEAISGEEDTSNKETLVKCIESAEVPSCFETSQKTCLIGIDFSAIPLDPEKKPMFLSKRWRDSLCRCQNCQEMYLKKGVGYLLDKEDSMEEYEKIAKQRRAENLEKQEGDALSFINGMGHVQKIEVLNGIAEMKNELTSFLGSFDSSRTITPADVREVFENLARKRQRMQ